MSKETDLSISVEDSTNTPVTTRFQVLKLKLDTLADSMTRISGSLSRFTQPRMAVDLTAEDEEVSLEESRQSEFDPY